MNLPKSADQLIRPAEGSNDFAIVPIPAIRRVIVDNQVTNIGRLIPALLILLDFARNRFSDLARGILFGKWKGNDFGMQLFAFLFLKRGRPRLAGFVTGFGYFNSLSLTIGPSDTKIWLFFLFMGSFHFKVKR